jgi:hypothetical protein
MRTSLFGAIVCAGLASAAAAQDSGGPMSAIDWLSDSVARPVAEPVPPEPDTAPAVTTQPVSVAPLGEDTRPDAIGILAASVTGLPPDLWGTSRPEDLARRISGLPPDMLPALQALTTTMMIAELDPPVSPDTDGTTLFLARIDKLLEMGALDQADALLSRAGASNAEIFRRWFDVSLLLGEENKLCPVLEETPALSPTYQARIFCLARTGDWNAASLLLGTGSALGLIPDDDKALFTRFLDPDAADGAPDLPLPHHPTPLTYRMFEAIGQAIPTTGLPLAFAHSDLRDNIGWKARIEAGERLARAGAVSDNQLLGLYTERQPAASGGVWDRVAALQKLEANLAAKNRTGTAEALPALWKQLAKAEVEVPISRIHGPELAALALPGEAGDIAFRMGLLSADYEAVALSARPPNAMDKLLAGIAQGNVAGLTAPDERTRAVLAGFTADGAPVRLASLLDTHRLGEAILRAMTLFTEGMSGDLDKITDALALFRAVGLEDTARRVALEYLILDRPA